MRDLIIELIPHAPQLGLFVAPNIPADKLDNALKDYAKDVGSDAVLALFDATLMGSAKDGAVFTASGFVFQNNDLEPAHTVDYGDIVDVDSRRKLIGGRRVAVTVNRGRATFKLEMDFSGKPDAAEYVTRFLKEAMLRGVSTSSGGNEADAPATNVEAVREALQDLHERGQLSGRDLEALLRMLGGS